jgi:hypothetical protein
MRSLLETRRIIRDYKLRLEMLLEKSNGEITPEAVAFSRVLDTIIGEYQLRNRTTMKIK